MELNMDRFEEIGDKYRRDGVAKERGLVNSVVAKDELLDAHLKMVRLILSKNEAS